MKILYRILFAMMVIVTCLLAFPICGFAENFSVADSMQVFVSNTIGEPTININSMLIDKVTKEIVDERYNMFSVEKPEKFTFDTSIYLVEYNVSTDYWNSVLAMNYRGLTEAIDYNYPTIYIPLFGDIADSKGSMLNRVIGHIKLTYSWSDNDYRFGMSLYNLADDNYKDKKNVGFYEEISDYLSQTKSVAQQVFMIRYPSSLTDGHEKIAVIQTKDDTVILDVSNSLNIMTEKKQTGRALAYTVSEYSTRRKEIEKDLYQAANGWEKNPAGGNADLNPVEKQNDIGIWILYILIGSFVAGVVIFMLLRKHHQHSSKC